MDMEIGYVAEDCTLPLAMSTQLCTCKGGVSIKRDKL